MEMLPIYLMIGVPIVVIVILVIASARANAERERRRIQAEADRKDRIYRKYGAGEIAQRIIDKTIWVNETSEQLRDSIGAPVDIDEKVLKTKRKEIWKYFPKGTNRYGLRVTVENGVVAGWEEKL